MIEKKIQIKVSELRALVREAMSPSRAKSLSTNFEKHSKDKLGNSKIVEFRSFDEDFAEKLSDKKYEAMAKQLYDAWSERGVDVDWAGVVNLYARNHSQNLAAEIDKTKLYEKVLSFVEKGCSKLDLPRV
jgi:hypothetical protein